MSYFQPGEVYQPSESYEDGLFCCCDSLIAIATEALRLCWSPFIAITDCWWINITKHSRKPRIEIYYTSNRNCSFQLYSTIRGTYLFSTSLPSSNPKHQIRWPGFPHQTTVTKSVWHSSKLNHPRKTSIWRIEEDLTSQSTYMLLRTSHISNFPWQCLIQ